MKNIIKLIRKNPDCQLVLAIIGVVLLIVILIFLPPCDVSKNIYDPFSKENHKADTSHLDVNGWFIKPQNKSNQ